MDLQTAMKNLQGEIKNLKAEVYSLKRSGHSGGAGAANKDNSILVPNWKREEQSHHPTWWITTYCWRHGEGNLSGAECKNKRPGHKAETTATTTMSRGTNFGYNKKYPKEMHSGS